jgi:hypothetical protein
VDSSQTYGCWSNERRSTDFHNSFAFLGIAIAPMLEFGGGFFAEYLL